MVNLGHNKIQKLNGSLIHLKELVFLDISFNAIETLEIEKELPKGLHVLRCNSNPFLRKPIPDESNTKTYFRKQFILYHLNLTELDQTPVLPVERLKYQGHVPPMLYPQIDA